MNSSTFGASSPSPCLPVSRSAKKHSPAINLKVLEQWYWPTSDSRGRQAEEALLRHGNVPLDDPTRCRQFRVALGDGSDPLRYINTLVIDQGGLDVPTVDRKNVVIVNGLGAALGVFYQNLEPISRAIPNCRLWAIDWLGMGRSGRPAFPKDPETAKPMDGIRFFLDSFDDWRSKQDGLDRFILVGHSLGGYLSALYALWNPDRIAKLVLASPAGLPPDHNTPEVEESMGGTVAVNGMIVPAWIRWLWSRNITPQCFVRFFGPLGPLMINSYCRSRFKNMSAKDVDLFADYMYHMTADIGSGEFALGTLMRPGAWAKEPLHNRLGQLTMPVSFIYGENDWMNHNHAEDAARHMKVPTKIMRVPDCGHQLYLEQPDAFNRLVIQECID